MPAGDAPSESPFALAFEPAAVLFDVDGTLADTEPSHLASLREVLGPRGIALTEEAYYGRWFGLSDAEALEGIAADAGRGDLLDEVAALVEAKQRAMLARIPRDVRAYPGAVELVRATAQRGPVAFVSAGLREEVDASFRAIGLHDVEGPRVAAEDVERSKPDPAGYRMALAALFGDRAGELAPSCLAIEDSPNGVTAARAAGLHVVACAHTRPAEALAHADRVVATIADLSRVPPRR